MATASCFLIQWQGPLHYWILSILPWFQPTSVEGKRVTSHCQVWTRKGICQPNQARTWGCTLKPQGCSRINKTVVWSTSLRSCQLLNYKPEDKVMLEGTNIETTCPTRKLANKCYSPFFIIQKVGSSAYMLKLPPSWSPKHPVFNDSLLTPYKSLAFILQWTPAPPPPDIINKVPEYKIKEIQDSQLFRGKLQYLVK